MFVRFSVILHSCKSTIRKKQKPTYNIDSSDKAEEEASPSEGYLMIFNMRVNNRELLWASISWIKGGKKMIRRYFQELTRFTGMEATKFKYDEPYCFNNNSMIHLQPKQHLVKPLWISYPQWTNPKLHYGE